MADRERDDLIARYLGGDREAIVEVRDTARIVVFARGHYVAPAEREDLVQEVLLNVYRSATAPGFELRHGSRAFIRAIAHRRCVDWLRRNRDDRTAVDPPPSHDGGPEAAALERERLELAGRVLDSLPESCRELIMRRTVEGLSYREIARLAGRSEQALRNQLYKCLRRARDMFRDLHRGSGDEES